MVQYDREGNVGIGTDNPTAKLAVNGTTQTKEIIVTEQAADWPDYVFSERYDLTPLEELEKYISLNKRLPGMPSPAQVKRDGQQLGAI